MYNSGFRLVHFSATVFLTPTKDIDIHVHTLNRKGRAYIDFRYVYEFAFEWIIIENENTTRLCDFMQVLE